MKTMRRALATLLTLLLLPVMAAAVPEAEPPAAPEIGIQLNGEALTFKSGVAPHFDTATNRNFVPFRDLFEAMGAAVEYDADTRVITAVRGDTTVTFSQDGTELNVDKAGVKTVIQSDVAPITIDGRTLVPIRFASQALGANVGWDQAAQTILVVDTPTLVAEKAGSYELYNKLSAQGVMPADKNHEMAMAMTMDLTMSDPDLGEIAIPVTADLQALFSGQAMDGTMKLTMDMSAILAAAMPGMATEMTMAYDAEVIFDMAGGVMYMQSAMLNESAGLAADTWISLSMADLLDEAALDGIDFSSLTTFKTIEDTLIEAINSISLGNVDDYAIVLETLDEINKLYGDDSFTKDGNTYTNTMAYNQDGLKGAVTIKLELDDDEALVGYAMTMELTEAAEGMSFKAEVASSADKVTVTATVESDGMSVVIDAEATIKETDKAPRTALPQGATVVDYSELAGDSPLPII